AYDLGSDLNKTRSGEHRDSPQFRLVLAEPFRPLGADVDRRAAYIARIDKQFDRIGAGEPVGQRQHRRFAELAYVTSRNLHDHNARRELLNGQMAMNSVEADFANGCWSHAPPISLYYHMLISLPAAKISSHVGQP